MAKAISPREWPECGYSIAPIEGSELEGGPTLKEWIALRKARHRIGDAELMPVSRYNGSKEATPEGDLASPEEA